MFCHNIEKLYFLFQKESDLLSYGKFQVWDQQERVHKICLLSLSATVCSYNYLRTRAR